MPVVGGYEGMMESQKHDMGMLLNAIGGAGKLQDMELHQDRGRLLRAQAGLAEGELSQEEAMARGMSEMGAQPTAPAEAGKPVSRAAPLYRMAEIAERAGAVKKALEYRTKASTIEHQENQDRMGAKKLSFYQRKDYQEDLEKLAGFYGDAKSQEDIDRGNRLFKATYPDRALPEVGMMPYTEYGLKGFKDSLLTAQQRLAAENKDEDQAMREEDQELRRLIEERRKKQETVTNTRRAEQDAAKAKAGEGKRSLAVGKDLPVLAVREISDAIFGGTIPPEFKKEVEGAKVAIAARAKQLFEGNRGLDMAAATARAVQESREAGEWTAVEEDRPMTTFGVRTGTEKVPGFKFKSRTSVSGVTKEAWGDGLPPEKLKSLANLWGAARAVPADRQFQDGTVYETPRGRLMRSGGKWFTQQEWAGR